MKKIIFGFILGAFLFSGVAYAATELNIIPNPFPIFTNNEPSAIQAYNIDGYTYGKWADVVREVNKALGQDVLTLKFDEVKSEIHLDTIQTVAPVVETSTSTGGGIMSEETKLTPDGMKAILYEGKWYIYKFYPNQKWVEEFNSKVREASYSINSDVIKRQEYATTANMTKRVINPEMTNTVILEGIPLTTIGGSSCIEYDYYVNTILPLIE